jgi:hypothetical protein
LEELYFVFNCLTNVCDLMGMERLTLVDLEDTQLPNIPAIEILSLYSGLKVLMLSRIQGRHPRFSAARSAAAEAAS